MSGSQASPHIREGNAPLDALTLQVLRRYGEFHPTSVDSDLAQMFIGFANDIIDEVLAHPYHDGRTIPYYVSINDARPVQDTIMAAGLLAYYCVQQGSPKWQLYMPRYQRLMNQQLWQQLNGNTPIQMRIVDGGTNPANSAGLTTDETNGTVS